MTATFARRSAFAGFLAWVALGTAVHLRWTTLGMGYGFMLNIAGILIFGVLVTTPLALAAVAPRAGEETSALPWRAAVLLQPLGGAGVFASFLFQPGPLAALFTLPWLAATTFMAATALARFLPRRFARAEEIWIDAGL